MYYYIPRYKPIGKPKDAKPLAPVGHSTLACVNDDDTYYESSRRTGHVLHSLFKPILTKYVSCILLLTELCIVSPEYTQIFSATKKIFQTL